MTVFTEVDNRLIAGVRAAVKDRGEDWTYPELPQELVDAGIYEDDWHYEGVCVNKLPNGNAACIVGYAAIYAGIDIPRAGSVDTSFNSELGISQRVLGALETAQEVQDGGERWGDALAAFEEVLADDDYK